MARLIGPDEASRTVFLTSGVNAGKAAAQGMSVPLYADQALTTPADVLSTTDQIIAGTPPTLTVDAYSQIPLFKYPDGADTVYTSVNGGPAVALYARTDERLDDLQTRVTAVEAGGTGDALLVHKAGAETISGVKTFSAEPVFPAAKALAGRLIASGTGLTGGGDLTADRTLAVSYGTTAGTAAQGNDSRLSDARVPTAQGLRLAVLGDSTARGSYSGDSQPGIGGATILAQGASWLSWASFLSGGKILRIKNAGIIGNTIAQMDARVVADICTAAEAPTACAIVSGYNDAYASVTLASYAASVRSIVAKLRQYGIVPILCTPLPTSNSSAIAALLVQYSMFVRRYAAQQNLHLLDFQKATMDPSTGGMTSAISTGGDGVHPGLAGQQIIGQYVSDSLSPLVATSTVPLVNSPLDTANIIPNPLFTGSPTSGRAPSVFIFGSLPSGATPAVVTDANVPGSMQRVTHSGSSVQCILAQRVTASGKWSVGDVLAVSGVVTTTSGLHAGLWVEFYATPYIYAQPLTITGTVTRGVFYAEVTVPPGSGSFMDIEMISGPGTGTVDFGQLSIYNLTTLGII